MPLQQQQQQVDKSQKPYDDGVPYSSPNSPQKSPIIKSNLKRLYGVGSAAVGLLEFGAKYGRTFSNEVLGILYLLTQIENTAITTRLALLLVCRVIQLPVMALLYVGLWQHQHHLILPFAIVQVTVGAFADISTLLMLLDYLENHYSFAIFGDNLKWLNLAIPLFLYITIMLSLLWVLYRCFMYLRARRAHDAQRRMEKLKEGLFMKSLLSICDDEIQQPDDSLIPESRSPNTSEDQNDSNVLEQATQLLNVNRSIRGALSSSSQRQPLSSNRRHFRTNSEGQHALHSTLSALTLSKPYVDKSSIEQNGDNCDTRSSTLPPNAMSNDIRRMENRKRMFSEKTQDLEATMFYIQQKNSRNLNRYFKGSAFSLQETLKFHMTVDKANSSTLTLSNSGATSTPPVSFTPEIVKNHSKPSINTSSDLSAQSLTLIEAPPQNQSELQTPIATNIQQSFLSIEADKFVSVAANEANPKEREKSLNSNENLNNQPKQQEPIVPLLVETTSRFSKCLVEEQQHPTSLESSSTTPDNKQ